MTSAVTATDLALFCWPLGVDEHDAADVPAVPLPRRPSSARGESEGGEAERATPVGAGWSNGGAHPRGSRVGAGRAVGLSPG
ncbi:MULTISPECIES: hypothetical protein [Actinosynnema]|uniref:hypothetical protein n=1 Tax=Actinosynnema TaxID=40566 RepID=UPI0020A24224|nr:hypothetical protein [Actinosynnema pretiosum]MCP2092214.1 hypothetical protein [Actinosynnema pretiosum]